VNMARTDWRIEPVMDVVKREVLALFGIDGSLLPVYESLKDVSCMEFDGESFREVLISHAGQKRKTDPNYFTKRWVDRMRETMASCDAQQVIVVPDVRFFEEFAAAVDLVGGANVYLMRIYRPGHDFTGDVGGYIRTDMAVFGNVECSIQNDQDEAFFRLETTVFAHGFVSRARAKVKL
jgi:hypothetical protein